MNTKKDGLYKRFHNAHANFVLGHPWIVIFLTVLLVVGLASGARFFQLSNNYRVFFSDENPELVAFEEFQDTYTKNDNIMMVIQPADGQPFTPHAMSAIEELTEQAWQIPFAIRVDSISNFQHTWANKDDLTVEDLVRGGANLKTEVLAEKKAIALAEPLLRGNLISPDADTVGINVTLQFAEKSITEVPEAASFARVIVADIQKKYPDLDLHIALTGVAMMNNSFAESGQMDFMTLVPIMYGILLLITLFALRSILATFATLLVIIFSMVSAVGTASYFGMAFDPISLTAPTIILTLAIADSIHILVTMRKGLFDGLSKVEAMRESLRINFVPVSITSLTTIIGFLALNFSDSPPFWYLGNVTSIGIAAAWLLSLTFLPSLIKVLPLRLPKKLGNTGDSSNSNLFDLYVNWLIAHRHGVLIGAGAVSLLVSTMAYRIELNDEWVKYFDHRVQFRNDAEFGMENLTGIYLIEYSLDAGEESGIYAPEYLNTLSKFTDWLREQPEVKHVYSFSDVIKRISKNMHGDDQEYYQIPQERELAAQYTLLYEMSLPFGLDLNDRVAIDKSSTRVSATLPEISTAGVRDLIERSEQWMANNAPASISVTSTGATVMFAHIAQRNIENMLTGNVIAIIAISIVMMIALRSWRLGLLSLIPNSIPVFITFGVWGVMVGQVGMAAATVTATSLGIIVDDTVHFLSKYLHARREKLFSKPDAVRYAFQTVGPAMVATSLILSIGFAVLSYSTFLINAHMGQLTAIAVVSAFLFDFTVLPALLLSGKPAEDTLPETTTDNENNNETENEIIPVTA